MLKTLITLMRGSAARAGEEIADRNALLILDQQIRDGAQALDRAKKALALSIAADRQEEARLATIRGQIADLETRTLAAMEAGRDDRARDGAAAIAGLEAERDAAETARKLFATEIARLRDHVSQAELRLANLDRGRRTARAAEAVRTLRKGRSEESTLYRASLRDAEETLARLQARQKTAADADDALDDLDRAMSPVTVAEKLAADGFGPRLKTTADDVLARLKARNAPAV